MKTKIWWSLASITGILVLSSVISVIEYKRVSTSVSALIAGDVEGLRIIKNLESKTEEYNLSLLDVIDLEDTTLAGIPQLKHSSQEKMERYVFSLSSSVNVDTLLQAYNACIESSIRMNTSGLASEPDSLKLWYFTEFRPLYEGFKDEVGAVDERLYLKLKTHSESFQDAFYRSIVPGMVAVASGLLLVFLLGYFFLSYYVHPIYKMLNAIEGYTKLGRIYNCKFEGDDQLAQLNSAFTDICEENSTLRKRLKSCKDSCKDSPQKGN